MIESAADQLAKEWVKNNSYPYNNCPNIQNKLEQTFLAGLKAGSQLDEVWHDYDAGEDCYEDSHEGKWVKRESDKLQWHKVANGDLPKEQKEYWCKVFYYESEETFNAFLWFDLKTKDFKFVEDIEVNDGLRSIFKVKAWCEIPDGCRGGVRKCLKMN